ncbi:VUT family protein, partial [Facilibium subflavum]|uniref:VUT family protein n=1 Tax=Facilibium subflavum TaxID=2219058 RepID=UPI0013C3023A
MTPSNITTHYRFLWVLIVSYVCVLLMANWYDARIISILGIETDAGTLIFPLSFLCADLITEVYGYKRTRLAIWAAFILNLIFLVYGLIITNLPSPEFAIQSNAAFDQIVQMN